MSNRVYVSTRKGLFTLERAAGPGGKWSVARAAFLGDNCPIVLPDDRNGRLYVAIDHGHFGGKLHRSDDAGETWREIGAPTYPAPPEGVELVKDPMRNVPVPWNLEMIWSLETGGPDQGDRLWCGTIPGGLFESIDAGANWSLVRSLWDRPERAKWFGGGKDWPGIHSICVDPRDSRRVTVGVSCGGVWATQDLGQTWACRADGMRAAYTPPEQAGDPHIQDPHRVVQCPSQPDVFWAQHHNGVFRSVDNCQSWQEIADIPPSVFGFPVVVHPRDGQTAWVVPAIKDERRIPVGGQVVVSRTRDGGKSFEVLKKGLPQEQAYDIVFRHALDIDTTGDRLVMGSTTGSVWISEDQGDSWQHVTAHLPPVYCVRFANAW